MALGYVDPRGHSYLVERLHEGGFEPKQLKIGDISFQTGDGQAVLIEYKRLKQFLADLQSGQMMKQVPRMTEAAPFCVLLLEYRVQRNKLNDSLVGYEQFAWKQVWNYMETLQCSGIHVQLATSEEHAVNRVLQLYHYYRKPAHLSALRGLSGDKHVAALCLLVEGIGPARAQALIKEFGSIGNLAHLAEDGSSNQLQTIQDVKGIGPKLAEAIKQGLWSHG